MTHRVLREGGNREAGIDAYIGGDCRAVADHQVLVAEYALIGVHHAAAGSEAITAPPRMWAVVGMLKSASVIALWAMPPVRLASQSAAWLATGMKVGIGRSGSCSVVSHRLPKGPCSGAQRNRVIERLHHQHDDCAPRPVLGEQHLHQALGVQDHLAQ